MESIETSRKLLESKRWKMLRELETDQRKQIPPQVPQKPCPEGAG